MTSISSTLVSVFPSNAASGVPLESPLQILFDRAMDEGDLTGIRFLGRSDAKIVDPTKDKVLRAGDLKNFIDSPDLSAVVEGTFSFERVSLTSTTDLVTTLDTTLAGNLWRTRLTFRPSAPLRPSSEYFFVINGPGVHPLQVSDPTGPTPHRPRIQITPARAETITVKILTTGATGVATFAVKRAAGAFGDTFSTARRPIQVLPDATLSFPQGTWTANDEYVFTVANKTAFTDAIIVRFTTSSGSLVEVPSVASTLVTGAPVTGVPVNGLRLVKSVPPANSISKTPQGSRVIKLTLSAPLDLSLLEDKVRVYVQPVVDHPNASLPAEGHVPRELSVSGNTLTITLTN